MVLSTERCVPHMVETDYNQYVVNVFIYPFKGNYLLQEERGPTKLTSVISVQIPGEEKANLKQPVNGLPDSAEVSDFRAFDKKSMISKEHFSRIFCEVFVLNVALKNNLSISMGSSDLTNNATKIL